MKGQANNESDKFGKRSEWLERGIWFAGGLVVAGLLMESAPEVGAAFAKHELPKAGTVGGSLVTIGVAAEVILGIFLAMAARRVQAIAEATVAEAHERAARAEQVAAEANLARVQLEQRMARRDIPRQQFDAIAERLSAFAGQRIIICSLSLSLEAESLASRIRELLDLARWKTERASFPLTTDPPDGMYCEGFSLSSTCDGKSMAAGHALIKELWEFAGGAGGALGGLDPIEDPRLQIIVRAKLVLP